MRRGSYKHSGKGSISSRTGDLIAGPPRTEEEESKTEEKEDKAKNDVEEEEEKEVIWHLNPVRN